MRFFLAQAVEAGWKILTLRQRDLELRVHQVQVDQTTLSPATCRRARSPLRAYPKRADLSVSAALQFPAVGHTTPVLVCRGYWNLFFDLQTFDG